MTQFMHSRAILATALMGALVAAEGCNRTSGASASDRTAMALEQCDPARYIPCIPQVAFLSVPLHDAGLYLTYSSQWAPGVSGHRPWDVGSLGLGGWSINPIQRYDTAQRVLFSGDGSWRIASSVRLPSDERVVPSYDGALAYVFDPAGRHVRTMDGHLGTVLLHIEYDAVGRLTSIDGSLDGAPAHLSVQRAPDGTARALAGTDGGTTSLTMEPRGRLTAVTNPAGATTRIDWDEGGHVVSQTDPLGGVAHYSYDNSGRVVSYVDADSVAQRFERHESSKSLEIRVSTTLGRHWTYRGELLDGAIRRTFIDRDGSMSTETVDPRGARVIKLADGTSYSVGALAHPVWSMSAPILTPVVQSRPDGVTARREVKYALQPQRGLPYMLAGSVTTVINGRAWRQDFDPLRRTVVLVGPAGRRTLITYDSAGRVLSHSAPGRPPAAYAYDAAGRMVSETIGAGQLARTTRYVYDANTGRITTTLPDGVVEHATVDKAGHMVQASAGDGSTAIAAYDGGDRLIQLQPAGGVSFTLGSSPGGRPTAFVPPVVPGDSSIESRSYDPDGQLTRIVGSGGRAVMLSYDDAGRVKRWSFDQGTRTIFYDPRTGATTRATDPSGVTTTYGYAGDLADRLTWSGPIAGSVGVTLDANGRPAAEAVNGADTLRFAYDGSGLLTRVGPLTLTRDSASGLVTATKLGVVETRQTFDANGSLMRATTTVRGDVVFELRYTRDVLGRIASVSQTTGHGKPSRTAYAYDAAGRLSAVRENGRPAESEGYDPAGNRVAVNRPSATLKAAYDDRDRAMTWGSRHYSWSPDGSLTRVIEDASATSFTYDDFGALRTATLPDGREVSYLVDADGRRVGRRVGRNIVAGYLYRLDGFVAAETDPKGRVVSRFGYDDLGHLALVERGGIAYRVITDAVGSPLLVIDSRNGNIAEAMAYSPWGRMMQDTAPGFTPFGFAGGLRDPDTDLLRMGARDYEPATGRWTAADPLRFAGGDANLYRYAAGDPVNRVDPRGMCISLKEVDIAITRGLASHLPEMKGENDLCPDAAIGTLTNPATPQNNNPPPPGDPPAAGNPPGNGSPFDWGCKGTICVGPDGLGCEFGSCHKNPFGFTCDAVYCHGPGNEWCFYCSMGDPHLQAGNGARFDLQAAGEFLMVTSRDGDHVVQARQEPYVQGAPVTVNSAVAANLSGDHVGVYATEPDFLLVNGVPVRQLDIERRLPHGDSIERHGGLVILRWRDGSRLTVSRVVRSLNYAFVPGPGVGPLRGLLGGAGIDSPHTLTSRDGAVLRLSDPTFGKKLYQQVGNSWRIRQSESLFHYWPGESTATFTNVSFPAKLVTAASLSAAVRSKAEAICRAVGVHTRPVLDDCILDVGITDLPAFAAASVALAASLPPRRAPSATASSSIASPSSAFAITLGDSVSPNHPARGAGIILHAGEKQSYAFSAPAGTSIFVEVGPCQGATPTFEVLAPDSTPLGGTFGCTGFGPVRLSAAGVHRIVVATLDTGMVRYRLTLRIAPFDQYAIRIGDTVSPDHPAPGAGIITSPGQKQSYAFAGVAGQAVYVGVGPCEGANPSFDLRAPDDKLLGGVIGNCHADIGRQVLPVTGTYHIVASTVNKTDVSRYSFFVHTVPGDQHFPVRLPITVSLDGPAAGSGRMRTQGVQQFYDFSASPGTVVHVESRCNPACSHLAVRVTRAGDTGEGQFLDLNYLRHDWTLPPGGNYTIQVRSTGFTGTYGFTASPAVTRRR